MPLASSSSSSINDGNDWLSRLPLDLLQDNVLDLLPASSLTNLARTKKALHWLLMGEAGEVVWRRLARRDFNFPVTSTGRRSGWRALYKQLSGASCYVWGANSNGRLGIAAHDHPIRSRIIAGGLVVPTRLDLPAPAVSLAATGWGFAAVTTRGELLFWGTLDAGQWAADNAPLWEPGRPIYQPMRHPCADKMGEIVQVSAGRKHVLARDHRGIVWEFRALGRTMGIVDAEGRWGINSGPDREVVAVEAGWDHSLVLNRRGDVFVWWNRWISTRFLAELGKQAGEHRLTDASKQGVCIPLNVESIKLPSLPTSKEHGGESIELIASGDNFVIALTSHSRLFWCDLSPPTPTEVGQAVNVATDGRLRTDLERLEAAFESGRRSWVPMRNYYDLARIRALPGLGDVPASTKITHISAHFQSFCAYSVPATSDPRGSIVLLGTHEWTEDTQPIVIPQLQQEAIISVSHGDYHTLALTSDGRAFSFGAFSSGALGLGHPQLLGTPLSAPHPPPPPAQPVDLPPPTRIAPSISRHHGFTPGRPGVATPPPPTRVETPTRIRFTGEETENETDIEELHRSKGKFVFAISASGWHSGCLAVDLDPNAASTVEPTIRLREGGSSHQDTPIGWDEAPNGPQTGPAGRGRMFGGRSLRIGFAGRGLVRGGPR